MTQEPQPLPSISEPESQFQSGLLTRLRGISWSKLHHSPYLLITLFALLALTATFLIFPNRPKAPPQPSPLPTPQASPNLPIHSPSPFATDSAILEIKDELLKLSTNLDQTDMTEIDLSPPALDLNVSFE